MKQELWLRYVKIFSFYKDHPDPLALRPISEAGADQLVVIHNSNNHGEHGFKLLVQGRLANLRCG